MAYGGGRGKEFLREHFIGELEYKLLEHFRGVHSMDIGSGFSKPMIRGMGFNRISVVENGIKQGGTTMGSRSWTRAGCI